MKTILKNPKKAIAMLLILTFAVSILMTMPATQAQVPSSMTTYPFVEAVPNPVGVGEVVLIRFGILQALADVYTGWTGVTVTVVKPSGDTQTLGPFKTDSTGGSITQFTPDQIGTYKLTTNFPQQPMPKDIFDLERGVFILAGTVMKASTSETVNLVVQTEPLPQYPSPPLPTDYWSRPIDPQLREWYSISGNWVSRPENDLGLYNDDAPETAHVLWSIPMTTGGLTGGLWGDGQQPVSSETGDAYEGKFANSVILNGILYYNVAGQGLETNGVRAIDLHTGKEVWFRNNTFLSFGQILYFNSFNYDGVFTYLLDASGSTWNAYDPFTGEWQFSFENMPSGTQATGPSGEILIYQIDYARRWMALWNSTACGLQNTAGGYALGADSGSWGNNVHKRTLDASNPNSYSWNVTIPAGLTAGSSFFVPILKVLPDRVMSIDFNQTRVRVWALNTKGLTKTSTSATAIFDKTWQAPAEWLSGYNTLHYAGGTDDAANGVIAVWSKELRKFYGFSTEDGSFLWETNSEYWSDAYGWGNVEHTWYFVYGKLISVGVGGIVYAYDLHSGTTSWTYNMTDAYNEPVTGDNWWGWISVIADGKVYVGTAEHSAEQPLPRGGPYICLNATTGEEIWRANGLMRQTRWGGNAIIGDSIIAGMDTYTQQIIAIGKGPTAVTVAAGPKTSEIGGSVVIEGTVMDTSPGTATDSLSLRFPNGVPAVSDASMTDWMMYVYKQFARPSSATGVEVALSVLDANNNFREIGKTTSDANGYYSFQWKSDIPGKYTVYASFAGTKGYWPSYAETSFAVDTAATTPAPSATTASNSATTTDLMLYIVGATIAIIIAIAIVGLLILRKHP